MTDSSRQPPCAIDAEQAVIGGLMIDSARVTDVAGWLTDADFYRRDHAAIYRAIVDMAGRNAQCDVVTVPDWLQEHGLLEQAGGAAYLIELASTTPSAANIVSYAEIVREKAQRRRLIERGMAMVESAFGGGIGSCDIAALAARDLMVMSAGATQRGARGMRDISKDWYADLTDRLAGGGRRLLTPWGRFNQITNGLQDRDLIFLAGRPSMGKSAAALCIATCAAAQGRRVLFFSLEMTDVSLFNRAIGSRANVLLEFFRNPTEDGDEWGRVRSAISDLRDLPLEIDEEGGLTIDQIVTRAKREHMRQPLGLLVIDHLHIVRMLGDNLVNDLADATGKLRALAKWLGCPVLVLGQLNRSLEQRQNKRPIMSDLRGCGAIEQDADLIVFVYRDDYYAEQDNRPSESPGIVEFIIAKQRNGVTGKAYARSALEYGRIDDIADYVPPRAAQKTVGTGFGNYSGSRSRTKQRSDVDG